MQRATTFSYNGPIEPILDDNVHCAVRYAVSGHRRRRGGVNYETLRPIGGPKAQNYASAR